MTRLSVNVNKVALLRNSRTVGIPSVLRAAELCVAAGAHGITVHPRPDQRHIRPSDANELRDYLRDFPNVEFNIEGNPFPEFMALVLELEPTQATLVPDDPTAATSDHGWDMEKEAMRLAPLIRTLNQCGIRVSLFMDVSSDQWSRAREIGAARVELYTQPYAEAFARGNATAALTECAAAARSAQAAGLGVNAGHDLNLQNLPDFCGIPGILEVSIGHALVSDALEVGLPAAVRTYLEVLRKHSA